MESIRPEMTTMNVSLPGDLRSFIEVQAREGGFHSVSEYLRDVMRQERRRVEQEKLERLLLDGLESGKPRAISRKGREEKLKRLIEHYGKRKPNGRKH